MARILLAWELGGGLGHIVRFERLIDEFRMRGHALSVAIPNAKHAGRLRLGQDCIIIVPEWPGIIRRRGNSSSVSWISYGDMLASIIFTSADEIAERISIWRRVFDETKADVVVADYAPGVVLAARDYIPLVNVGDGYTVPPHDMESFPRLWPGSAPLKHRESDAAEILSVALSRFGVTRLINYPNMNAATAHATMTIPMLDVYREFRSGGWLGGGPFTLSKTPPDVRAGLYVTLREDKQFDARLIEGIVESGVGGTIVIPNMDPKVQALFANSGLKTWDVHQPLNEVLETARVLVHFGGMGVANAGIAKGVPQLIIYTQLEQYHTGKAIADAGAGISLDYRTITKQKISTTLRTLVQENAYLDRASQLAEENSALLKSSSIKALCDLTESIIQAGTH